MKLIDDPKKAEGPPPESVVIAIMGASSVCKARFIKALIGKTEPRTTMVTKTNSVKFTMHTIKVGTKHVVLLETPAFEDETLSDAEVFFGIATWVQALHRSNVTLSGIVYLHPISERRLARYARSNFFSKVIGEDGMPRVVLATTQWDLIKERHLKPAADREEWYKEAENWGMLLAMGAGLARFEGTQQSGLDIIHHIVAKVSMDRRQRELVLKLQRELIYERRPVYETDAGAWVVSRLRSAQRHLEHGLEKAMKESEDAKSILQKRFGSVHESPRMPRTPRTPRTSHVPQTLQTPKSQRTSKIPHTPHPPQTPRIRTPHNSHVPQTPHTPTPAQLNDDQVKEEEEEDDTSDSEEDVAHEDAAQEDAIQENVAPRKSTHHQPRDDLLACGLEQLEMLRAKLELRTTVFELEVLGLPQQASSSSRPQTPSPLSRPVTPSIRALMSRSRTPATPGHEPPSRPQTPGTRFSFMSRPPMTPNGNGDTPASPHTFGSRFLSRSKTPAPNGFDPGTPTPMRPQTPSLRSIISRSKLKSPASPAPDRSKPETPSTPMESPHRHSLSNRLASLRKTSSMLLSPKRKV